MNIEDSGRDVASGIQKSFPQSSSKVCEYDEKTIIPLNQTTLLEVQMKANLGNQTSMESRAPLFLPNVMYLQ